MGGGHTLTHAAWTWPCSRPPRSVGSWCSGEEAQGAGVHAPPTPKAGVSGEGVGLCDVVAPSSSWIGPFPPESAVGTRSTGDGGSSSFCAAARWVFPWWHLLSVWGWGSLVSFVSVTSYKSVLSPAPPRAVRTCACPPRVPLRVLCSNVFRFVLSPCSVVSTLPRPVCHSRHRSVGPPCRPAARPPPPGGNR